MVDKIVDASWNEEASDEKHAAISKGPYSIILYISKLESLLTGFRCSCSSSLEFSVCNVNHHNVSKLDHHLRLVLKLFESVILAHPLVEIAYSLKTYMVHLATSVYRQH